MDGTLHGKSLPKNIFFTAAINPLRTDRLDGVQVHRRDYLVHQLPRALENLKVSYGILDRQTLKDYIQQKIATFTISANNNRQRQIPLEQYAQATLTRSILNAQDFCESRLGMFSLRSEEELRAIFPRCYRRTQFCLATGNPALFQSD